MATNTRLATIDHFVVLMLENRSFDQVPGFFYSGKGYFHTNSHLFSKLLAADSVEPANR